MYFPQNYEFFSNYAYKMLFLQNKVVNNKENRYE